MNKHVWTEKILGEVGDVITGSTPSTKDIGNYNSNDFCFIKPSDIPKEGIGQLSDSEFYISNKAFMNSRKLPKGSVLTTCIGIIGKVGILQIDATCNQQINAIIPSSNILSSFLAYTILSKRQSLENMANAPVVPIINKKGFSNLVIPVPSLSEQGRIVAELDLLSGIIEKKKEQLKAYDQLAQSIFYNMFGDPINNEKGWEVKRFEEVCSSMTKGPFGSDIKKSLYVPKSKDTYKVYIQINAIEKDATLGSYYISKEYFDNKMFRFEVKPNDYIITCDGTLGKFLRLPQSIEKGIISASLLRLTLNKKINYKYFEHIWDCCILHQQTKDIRNTALKHLPSASKMGKTLIPLPPLSLQQEFAERVEAIERQKALVRQSIDETQTLFDSRMDFWFE